MAKNAVVIDSRIVMTDKKNFFKRMFKKGKKFLRYEAIKNFILEKKYKMVLGTIHIEFTSYCNLRCQMCPSSIDTENRGRGFMEVNLFKEKIIDYVVNNPQFSLGLINLWQGGEILLYPKFEEMLCIIGKARKEYKRFPRVNLLTNVMLLDEERSKIILDSRAIDEVYFSIDCGNKKDFEDMRCGAKWEKVLENANTFIKLNNERDRKVIIGILSITSLEKSSIFATEFLDLVNKVNYFHPRPAHNWDGNFNLNLGKYKSADFTPKKGLCGRVTNTVAVLWNGLVVPCCQDLTGRGVIGDLNKQTLFEIFNGEIRKRYIDLMQKGKRNQIELCKNCSL